MSDKKYVATKPKVFAFSLLKCNMGLRNVEEYEQSLLTAKGCINAWTPDCHGIQWIVIENAQV